MKLAMYKYGRKGAGAVGLCKSNVSQLHFVLIKKKAIVDLEFTNKHLACGS